MPNIFLSPSLQPYNEYAGGGNEQYYMNLLADAMEPYLRTNGIQFTRNKIGTSVGQSIRDSNAGYYDLHLALHTNSAAGNLAGTVRGADFYYYTNSSRGLRAAEVLADNYKRIYPLPNLVRTLPTTTLAEVTKTNAPTVLAELAFHDNPEDADFIRNNLQEIAANLVQGLTLYFGLPFISPPQAPRAGKVVTQGGNLNLRSKPSLEAQVLTRIPNGTSVTVLGEWQGWYVVEYNGIVGYSDAGYIQIV